MSGTPPSPTTLRLMALDPGKQCFVSVARVRGHIVTLKRHHPDRKYTSEAVDGGFIVRRVA